MKIIHSLNKRFCIDSAMTCQQRMTRLRNELVSWHMMYNVWENVWETHKLTSSKSTNTKTLTTANHLTKWMRTSGKLLNQFVWQRAFKATYKVSWTLQFFCLFQNIFIIFLLLGYLYCTSCELCKVKRLKKGKNHRVVFCPRVIPQC